MPDEKPPAEPKAPPITRERAGGLAGHLIASLFGGNRRAGAMLGGLAAHLTRPGASQEMVGRLRMALQDKILRKGK